MNFGLIGLGKMGLNLVKNAIDEGMKVVVLDREEAQIREAELYSDQVIGCYTLEEFIEAIPQPRIVWLMLPAGSITNSIVEELTNKLSAGDILIDGGNSYYKDNLQQNEKLKAKKIDFFDVGTSGGDSWCPLGWKLYDWRR